MLGLNTLDVGIGMALMFLFVSVIASAIREFGETILKTRSVFLERGIREMMGESSAASYKSAMPEIRTAMVAVRARAAVRVAALTSAPPQAPPPGSVALPSSPPANSLVPAEPEPPLPYAYAGTAALYNHHLISSLYVGSYGTTPTGELPSYIPSASFARAALDMAARAGQVAGTTKLVAQDIRDGIANLPNSRLQMAVLNALDVAGDDLVKAQKALEQWFDASMDRVSGWYKRRTQYWLFGIGLACAVVMNIDALTIMQTLSTDAKLREQVVVLAGQRLAAQSAIAATTPAEALANIKVATAQMGEVNWPIGWSEGYPAPQKRAWTGPNEVGLWAKVALGWLITGFGVTFGAAFWFDVLNKFMVIRSTVKPDEKSPKEPPKS